MDGEIYFLALVAQNRLLYDKTHKDFKNAKLRETTWAEIGVQVCITGEEAAKKFTSLRQKYVREKQFEKDGTRNGKEWPLLKHMEFLKDVIKSRKNVSNIKIIPPYDSSYRTNNTNIFGSTRNEDSSNFAMESHEIMVEPQQGIFPFKEEDISSCYEESSQSECTTHSTPPHIKFVPIPTTTNHLRHSQSTPTPPFVSSTPTSPLNNNPFSNKRKCDDFDDEVKDLNQAVNPLANSSHKRIRPRVESFCNYLAEILNERTEQESKELEEKILSLVFKK